MLSVTELKRLLLRSGGSPAIVIAGSLCLLSFAENMPARGGDKIDDEKAHELLQERDMFYGADDPFGENSDLYYADTVTPAAPAPLQEAQPVVVTSDDDEDDDDSTSSSSGSGSGGSGQGGRQPPGGGVDPPDLGSGGVVDPPPGGG